MSIHHIAAKWRFIFLVLLTASLTASFFFVPPPTKAASTAAWKTFHDPIYGFSFDYPANWLLIAEKNGSHITLINPATQTTISPIVSTQAGTPADYLNQATAVAGAKTRLVAGHQAVDYFLPYVPTTQIGSNNGATPGPLQGRTVVLPVLNTLGSTNLYTFMLLQPTDTNGKASAAEESDHSTFEAIVDTFSLPAIVTLPGSVAKQPDQSSFGAMLNTVSPSTTTVPACPSAPATSTGGAISNCTYPCDAVCWADANWRYTYYDDSSGPYAIYCDSAGFNTNYSYSTNPHCTHGNLYGAQVPSNGVGGGGSGTTYYFQPNFQCADFVSRALVQNYQVAGVGSGGVNGKTPATPPIGTYSFQTYRFTYTPYSSNTTYNLILVSSFKQYLLNSGLGINIGTNISQAQAGDVVIYYNSSGTAIHTMITTSAGFYSNGRWDVLMDGHNASAYHNLLSWWLGGSGIASFSIIHMRGSLTGSNGLASLSGGSWTSFTDNYGQSSYWAYTVAGSSPTASAQFPDSAEYQPCALAVYIPSGYATAGVYFQVQMANGSWVSRYVNENNIDGWALLYKWGELSSTPTLIKVDNNNNSPYQQLGVGQMAFLC